MKIRTIYIASGLLPFLVCTSPAILFSQNVSLSSSGAVAATSSMLDISSTGKGVLIPQVSLVSTADVATITSPATSLLVYNTNASMTNGSGTGYYYWNGTKWTPVTVNSVGSGACFPTMITNELNGAGAPCAGCGVAMTAATCGSFCSSLNYLTYTDWRVPTFDELVNLLSIAPNSNANADWTATVSTGGFGPVFLFAIIGSTGYNDQVDCTSAVPYCRCVR